MKADISTAEKLKLVQKAWPLWVGVIAKAVVEKFGNEGREVIKQALRQQARVQIGKLFSPEKDMQGVVNRILPLMSVVGFDPLPEIIELTPTRAKIRMNFCPLQERWKIVHAPHDMCEIWGSYGIGEFQALNPNLIHRIEKSLFKGDPYCIEVWEIKT